MEPNTNKKGNIDLWTERYRPVKLNDVLLPSSFKNFFKNIVDSGELTNLLIYSTTPGSGKTTVSKAICNELDIRYLYLNISDERGIDVLRTKIKQFASVKTLQKKMKCIILDEFDGSTPELQDALRVAIEEYHNTCRFIITCNYVSKIIPALREGRLMEFDFNMNDKKIVKEMEKKVWKRLCNILDKENIKYDKQTVAKLVVDNFPNNRKMVASLQKYSMMYGVIDENIFNVTDLGDDFFDLVINKDFVKARQYIIDKNVSYDEMYSLMYKKYVPKIRSDLRPRSIITISDYMYKHSFAIDPEITFSAMLIELMSME
jgi:DNA polymerase III delta prime subunit